jgi:hypothetical protein
MGFDPAAVQMKVMACQRLFEGLPKKVDADDKQNTERLRKICLLIYNLLVKEALTGKAIDITIS